MRARTVVSRMSQEKRSRADDGESWALGRTGEGVAMANTDSSWLTSRMSGYSRCVIAGCWRQVATAVGVGQSERRLPGCVHNLPPLGMTLWIGNATRDTRGGRAEGDEGRRGPSAMTAKAPVLIPRRPGRRIMHRKGISGGRPRRLGRLGGVSFAALVRRADWLAPETKGGEVPAEPAGGGAHAAWRLTGL